MSKETVSNIFNNTLSPRDLTKFTLFRGVTDFTNLQQFDLYETGYSFLICLDIPKFLSKLRDRNDDYKSLINNYRHIIEYEFRGCQGIDAIQSDVNQINNGIDQLSLITRVQEQSGSTFNMSYFERSGSVITKTHELFLRGIKDPRTQMKRYCGLYNARIGSEAAKSHPPVMQDKGFQYEVFHFLLIVTDNSGLNLEKAYILAACQPTTANTDIYNVERGSIQFSELSLAFNGFPITGRIVNAKAVEFLDYINQHTCFDEMEFGYNILTDESLEPGGANSTDTSASGGPVDSPTYDDIVSKGKA